HGEDGALTPLVRRLESLRERGATVMVACHSSAQAERTRRLLLARNLMAQIVPLREAAFSPHVHAHLVVGEISAGFVDLHSRLALFSDEDAFGPRAPPRRTPRRPPTSGARRAAHQGYAYTPPDAMYRQFEADFEFEETPDQERAIGEVLGDMQQQKPMDRLVCGDVGYGKTEVALRAAFKAVEDKKQVAVLVPTTVLAAQHHRTFSKRFADYPITVEVVSRFQGPKETKDILSRAREGKVDVLVGTHRLLSQDVSFKELGLVVVDEEQRFGVKHKEQLKKLRKLVDVLTLTATPIPRTLHMAMMGVRDLSIIGTPPVDRRAIRTFVSKFDGATIKEAIERELGRGGQVFFLHNRVQSIAGVYDYLHRLVPEARIAVAHGQMPEGKLEKVMTDFIDRKHDVLLCTA